MAITDLRFCPNCHSSWVESPIPEDKRHLYGGRAWYSRLIGVQFTHPHEFAYDGVSIWLCPDCNTTWCRWCEQKIEPGEPAHTPWHSNKGAN